MHNDLSMTRALLALVALVSTACFGSTDPEKPEPLPELQCESSGPICGNSGCSSTARCNRAPLNEFGDHVKCTEISDGLYRCEW